MVRVAAWNPVSQPQIFHLPLIAVLRDSLQEVENIICQACPGIVLEQNLPTPSALLYLGLGSAVVEAQLKSIQGVTTCYNSI